MEKFNNKGSSAKLKHRLTWMLLGSSCTTTTTIAEAAPDPCTDFRYRNSRPSRATDDHRPRRVDPVGRVKPLFFLMNKKENDKEKRALIESVSPSSSLDSENDHDLFSSDEEEKDEDESGTLFSSKSFSTESSEFYHSSRKKKKKKKNTRRKSMKSTRRPPRRRVKHSQEPQPLVSISSSEKETKPEAAAYIAGFPVVKRSTDPYGDFRSSMAEMIVERGMSRARDLERLLHAYLHLNSPRHYQAILEAFSDVCEAIFGK
ncbi:unnamed protein product [Musa acuminata subsp. malaccensis]|uniref:Transcription repressor n=1 Tax=Musa acuminata subsp. malaccensis TaxID=214687 RepID=A0A804ITI3_MUSAM|nr:unnamed protein product [Musa acuminata subsp. malaccensis]